MRHPEQEITGVSDSLSQAPTTDLINLLKRARKPTQKLRDTREVERLYTSQNSQQSQGKDSNKKRKRSLSISPIRDLSSPIKDLIEQAKAQNDQLQKRVLSKASKKERLDLLKPFLKQESFPDALKINHYGFQLNLPVNASIYDPLSIFQLFITLRHLEIIATYTNEQANLEIIKQSIKNNRSYTWKDTTAEEIGAYLDARLLMGVHPNIGPLA